MDPIALRFSIILQIFYRQVAAIFVAGALAAPEPEADPWYTPYGGHWGRKRRDADSDAVAEPEPMP